MVNRKNVSLSEKDKLSFISNMSTLLSAGIPIMETVEALAEDSKGGIKIILEGMREDLVQGKQVNATFATFPKIFNRVTVNVIRAAEEAGNLDVTLKDLKQEIKKEIEFSDTVKSALLYPIIIGIVFFGVLLLILVVVIPKISLVFSRLNVVLPLPTKILIFVSNTLLTYTIPLIIFTIILFIFLYFLFKTKKTFIVNVFSSMPVISSLMEQIDLTHFSRSFYLLLCSGITINSALELAGDVVVKKNIAKAINRAYDVVMSGKKLSEGLKEKRSAFSGIMIKMIEAGERTGTLDKSMLDISEYLDYQVTNSLKNVTTLLEPVMLVVVGVLVGVMMMAIIAPIYSLIGQVGGSK